MKHAINPKLVPAQPSGNIPAAKQRYTAGDHPPDAGTDTQVAGVGGRSGIHTHRPQTDPGTQCAEQQLDHNNEDNAAEDSGPGDASVDVGAPGEQRGRANLVPAFNRAPDLRGF